MEIGYIVSKLKNTRLKKKKKLEETIPQVYTMMFCKSSVIKPKLRYQI